MNTQTVKTPVEASKRRNGRRRHMRGELHEILSRGLPDMCDRTVTPPVCNIHTLAEALGVTYQNIYKILSLDGNQKITPQRAEQIIDLSKTQKSGGKGFKPLTIADLWPFVG